MYYKKDPEFQRILEEVRLVPVEEIIGREIELVQKGSYFLGLCPFHPDRSLGSFVVNPTKHNWSCFTDGIFYEDGIKFIRRLYNIGFEKAVLKIAVDFGIISSEHDFVHKTPS